MSAEKKYLQLYVSLDSLIDTRLGTISKIDKDLVSKILLDGKYHTRDEDVFEGIDKEVYNDLYKKRDVLTLANSLLTNMMPLLRHLIGKLNEQAIVSPYHEGGKVVVNLYPYKLTKEEQNEMGNAITAWIHDLAPVSFINYSPTELTPIYCKNTFSLMVMYDYQDWLEGNSELFLSTQMPEITMFVPAIYFVNKPSEEELERITRESMSPLNAIQTLAKGIIDLMLIDVTYFSIVSKDKIFKDI